MKPCDELQLLRYLDNRLTDRELKEFRDHLRACTYCTAQLEEEQELSHLLKRTRPLYSASSELEARVAAVLEKHSAQTCSLRQEGPMVWFGILRWRRLSAAALVILLCLAMVPAALQRVRAASYVEAAVVTHRSYLAGSLTPEIRSDSPEVVTAWFVDKVPFHFRLPSSESTRDVRPAYRLAGASLVVYKSSPAVVVLYEAPKEKITLLVASSKSAIVAGGDEIHSGALTFHYRSEVGFKVISWSNHGLSYALVSSVSGSAQQSCMVCHQNMADHDVSPKQR